MSGRRSATVVPLPRRIQWDYALVPPGEYDARVLGSETRLLFFGRSPKLAVWWAIIEMGHVGTVLPAWYAVPHVRSSRPRRNGYYCAVGRSSRLARDLAAMLGRRPTVLHGPFPVGDVERHIYRVSVVTVMHDREQIELPEAARYSRVERVLREVQ